jgi:predicted outer membrane repeat protein
VTALAVASLLVVAMAPAEAAPIAVTTAADSGAGSLRAAFAAASTANADTEIDIPANLGPITLTTGALSYDGGTDTTHTLTLVGTGGDVTVKQQASATDRVIHDTSTGLLTIDHVTISGGALTGNGGGISAAGPVTATNSTISGNAVTGNGGGISAAGAVTVTNSTVSGNTATGNGGGISGAVAVKVTNSTISGNTATGNGGGISAADTVTLVYATVVSNTAAVGANLFGTGNALLTFGSVVALHLGGGANCSGPAATTSGYNYSDDATCGFTGTGDSQLGTNNPLLSALADNGGPTLTQLPQATSPLVGAIPNATCNGGDVLAGSTITSDQRGVTRPQLVGCDIGAVEVQGSTLNIAKVVSGTSTSAFSEQVNCVASSVTTVANVVLSFKADGTPDPTTTPVGWVVSGSTWQLKASALTGTTCTVTETVTGGASSVSYGCAWTLGAPDVSVTVGCPGASSAASATPATVTFDGLGDSATVTVTNTFDAVPAVAPTPVAPAPAATPVAEVAPKFTG